MPRSPRVWLRRSSSGAVPDLPGSDCRKRRLDVARQSGSRVRHFGRDAGHVSNIDVVMQWNFLTRERFLAAWVVLFALPGLYLLGFLRMEGVARDDTVGIWRLCIGTIFLVFAMSLIPGMFGGRLGELDAYVPLPAGGTTLGATSGTAMHRTSLDEEPV
jgi:hypothetical protein